MNVTIPISTDIVPRDKIESLNIHVLRLGTLLQTHVISQLLGLARERTIGMLQLIATEVHGQLHYLIYHDSCPYAGEAFVEERPMREGLPSVPYVCPVCEYVVKNERDLSYDIALRLPPGIEVRIESPYT